MSYDKGSDSSLVNRNVRTTVLTAQKSDGSGSTACQLHHFYLRPKAYLEKYSAWNGYLERRHGRAQTYLAFPEKFRKKRKVKSNK
jgi:hypothetical protein